MKTPIHHLMCLLLLLLHLGWPHQSLAQSVDVGRVFPPFDAKDAITGNPVNLIDFRGKVVLIDFWATWCGPCIRELPNVQRIYQKYKDRGLEVISISLDSDRNKFKSFLRQNKMNWPQIMEGGGWNTRLAKKYGVRGIPKMYLIDANGKVVSDSARGEALSRAVEKAISTVTNPQPSESGGVPGNLLDRKEANDLLNQLTQQQELIKSASAPYATLNRDLKESTSHLKRATELLDSASGKKQAAVPYGKAYEIIHDGRVMIFRDGAMSETVILLPPPPPTPQQAAQLQALQRVEQDISATSEACQQLQLSIDQQLTEVYAAQAKIIEIQRQLRSRSGDINKIRSEVDASRKQVETATNLLNQAWSIKLKQANKTISKLIGDDKQRLADLLEIEQQTNACQELLKKSVRDSRLSRQLKKSCIELWNRVERFLMVYSGLTDSEAKDLMPTNPFANRGYSDIQARVATAKALDRLEQLVAQWEANKDGSNLAHHPSMQELTDLQQQLQQAGEDAEKLRGIEEQYNNFCRSFLQQLDKSHSK